MYTVVLLLCVLLSTLGLSKTVSSFRRSLSLIEILLGAAEEGFYTEVMEMFSLPIKQCPEVLCLGLVQFEVSTKTH